MKQWQRVLLFPVAALGLGLLTQAIFPGEFPRADEGADDGDFPRVTWGETAPRVVSGEWLLVDARDEEHYAAQHIPGAISLPAHAYPEIMQFFAEDYGTDKTTVVYCGTEDCDVSTELAARLRDETGLSDVRVLEGGFLGWQRSQ